MDFNQFSWTRSPRSFNIEENKVIIAATNKNNFFMDFAILS